MYVLEEYAFCPGNSQIPQILACFPAVYRIYTCVGVFDLYVSSCLIAFHMLYGCDNRSREDFVATEEELAQLNQFPRQYLTLQT